VAYNIAQQYGDQLNRVDFEVDRYELDRLLTHNWDPVADSVYGAWVPPGAETTFDLNLHYRIGTEDSSYQTIASISTYNGGFGYDVGDQILVLGSQLGGEDGVNDATITVMEINEGSDSAAGIITIVNVKGQARLFSSGAMYNSVAGTNIIGTGSNATFDFLVASGETTTFDASSMRFEAPVDMYSSTDVYDKYLVFPRRNILV
jgi:hypothetical protein